MADEARRGRRPGRLNLGRSTDDFAPLRHIAHPTAALPHRAPRCRTTHPTAAPCTALPHRPRPHLAPHCRTRHPIAAPRTPPPHRAPHRRTAHPTAAPRTPHRTAHPTTAPRTPSMGCAVGRRGAGSLPRGPSGVQGMAASARRRVGPGARGHWAWHGRSATGGCRAARWRQQDPVTRGGGAAGRRGGAAARRRGAGAARAGRGRGAGGARGGRGRLRAHPSHRASHRRAPRCCTAHSTAAPRTPSTALRTPLPHRAPHRWGAGPVDGVRGRPKGCAVASERAERVEVIAANARGWWRTASAGGGVSGPSAADARAEGGRSRGGARRAAPRGRPDRRCGAPAAGGAAEQGGPTGDAARPQASRAAGQGGPAAAAARLRAGAAARLRTGGAAGRGGRRGRPEQPGRARGDGQRGRGGKAARPAMRRARRPATRPDRAARPALRRARGPATRPDRAARPALRRACGPALRRACGPEARPGPGGRRGRPEQRGRARGDGQGGQRGRAAPSAVADALNADARHDGAGDPAVACTVAWRRLQRADRVRLRPLGPLTGFEGDALVLLQGAEAVGLDG